MTFTDNQTHTTETTSLTGKFLKPEDLPEIMKLQETIAEGLAQAGTPRHIVMRSKDYFLKHLLAPHTMYGMVNEEGEIVAQSIFRISDIDMKEELCVEALPDMDSYDRLSVAQGVLVHPEYQGYGLMQVMLDKWIQWCKENEIAHLAARTESTHLLSQKGFLKNNFNRVATVIDPKDNAEVCVLHRVLDEQELCMNSDQSPEELHGLEDFVINLTCS